MNPASITQVRKSRDGHMVAIEQDLLDVISRIREIDPRLSVKWSVDGEYFAIYEDVNGKDELVFTTNELDQRVVERLQFLASVDYDYVKEIDRADKDAEKAQEHEFSEKVGERGERLAHALRKDLQYQGKAFIGKKV